MLDLLQPTENWDRLNEAYRQLAGYKQENSVKCYGNLYLAVDEITRQLASFLAHKRAFTWMKGMSPLFDGSLPYFLREGFQVQGVDWKVLEQEMKDPQAWVQALPPNTLFVLVFEDHAVTGKKIDNSVVEKLLADKKIYMIRVSHWGLPGRETEISPYTIWIGPAQPGSSAHGLVVCGSRFRAPENSAPFGPWSSTAKAELSALKENKELVSKIESEFGSDCWFSPSDHRRYDRIVLCCQDLAGDRVIHRLEQKWGPLSRRQLHTTHTCAWNSIKIFRNWWTPEPSPEQLRGLLVFSLDLALRADFVSQLKQTLQELRTESVWA